MKSVLEWKISNQRDYEHGANVRNKDNPFLHLRKRQLSVRRLTTLNTWIRPLLQIKQDKNNEQGHQLYLHHSL
jgi:hypothetical protein